MTTTQPNRTELTSIDDLRARVAGLLDVPADEIGLDDDLIAHGMDSLRIMAVANDWRERGVELDFGDLVEAPTVRAWWELGEAALPFGSLDLSSGPDGPFPLTPVQHAYWVGRSDSQVLGGVSCHFYLELDGGAVDVGRLDKAVLGLTERHELLRARFLPDGTQEVLASSPFGGVAVHDLRGEPSEVLDAHLASMRDRLAHRVLPVEDGHVFDLQLTVLSDRRTRLHVNVDLLVADVMSIKLFLDELAHRYASPSESWDPLEIGFAEYLATQDARRAERRADAGSYWADRLADLPGGPALPLARMPETVAVPRVLRRQHVVPAADWGAICARAREHGLTPSTVLATAFAEVVAAWSESPRFLLNVPLFDREAVHPDVRRMIADFTNLVLLEVDLADVDLVAQARRLQSQLHRDLAHSSYSAVEVLRDLRRARPDDDVSAPVVFTSAIGVGDLYSPELREHLGEPGWMLSQAPQVWLDHQVTEFEGGLVFNWDCVEELFPVGVLDAMFDAYVGVLGWLALPGSDWESRVPVGLPSAQVAVRARVNATAGPVPVGLLHEGFFARAESVPDAPALLWASSSSSLPPGASGGDGFRGLPVATSDSDDSVDGLGNLSQLLAVGAKGCDEFGVSRGSSAGAGGFDGFGLSFGALSVAARRVAAALVAVGVVPGDAVAVALPKGPAQVVATFGVLAAGGVYVPVGVDQPVQRRERIYASAGTKAVVTDDPSLAPGGSGAEGGLLGTDDPSRDRAALMVRSDVGGPVLPARVPVVSPYPDVEPLARLVDRDPGDLAYVIYTSGSTGEPKGVEVSHRAARNTVDALNARYSVNESDRVLAVSALDFDLSVYDLFGLTAAGGALVLVDEADRREPAVWLMLAERFGVTVWNTVPALLDMALTLGHATAFDRLRVAMVSGDWVGLDLQPRLAVRAPDCRLVAMGGATEASIWSNVFDVDHVDPGWSSIPYGTPLPNQRFRVVNAHGGDCPDWVPGELWIGGVGVADGYRGDPDRTADRFVTDTDGERWYRTGDQGRYWPDGTLEFLGRTDHQVKIRGHRVELGEIEAALEAHPHITRAVAVVTRDNNTATLHAAITTNHPIDTDTLRPWLAQHLANHAIPTTITTLDTLPLTPNAKIDRTTITNHITTTFRAARPEHEVEGPVGATEELVAGIWSELLDVTVADRREDFFRLGGDSLLATRVVSRLHAAGFGGVRITTLFEAPTLAAFAAQLQPRTAPPAGSALVADPDRRYEPFPLTDVQQAYLVGRSTDFTLGGVGSHWYCEFDGTAVDLDRLEDALNRLIARHEMLRVVIEDGMQRIQPEVPRYPIERADAADGLRDELSHQIIDPSRWPLFDVRVVRTGDATRLAMSFDYIVLDALSIMIVLRELGLLYDDLDAELPPVEVSFRDYVQSVRPEPQVVARAQQYWADRLDTLPAPPSLPLAVEPALVTAPRFTRRTGQVHAAEWQAICAKARDHGLTSSTVLAASFAEVLATWSGQAHLTMNLTLFDRRDVHSDIGNVLGDFTNLLLVAYEPDADDGWAGRARTLQTQVWSDLEHSDASAVWVLRELARRNETPEVPMPVVFTSTLGVSEDFGIDEFPYGRQGWGLSQTPQVWLDHQVTEFEGGLVFNWDCVEELFPVGVLDAMFDAYVGVLGWLALPGSDWESRVPVGLPSAQVAVRARVNATAGPVPVGLLHEGFFARAESVPDAPALLWASSSSSLPPGASGGDGFRGLPVATSDSDDSGLHGGNLSQLLPVGAKYCDEFGVSRGSSVGAGGWDGFGLSYGELSVAARRVAAALVAAGIVPGDAVAVALPKGPDQVIATLGVLAAGGVYVPVGVDQPVQRRERIHANAGTRAVVTDDPSLAPVEVVVVAPDPDCEPLDRLVDREPDDLAYVIYTSGSTGEPKGVEVTHRAALNTVDAINSRYSVTEADRVLAVSALDFDLSVFDLFGLTAAGGALILVDELDRREPAAWLLLADRFGATIWNTVPALLDMALTLGHPTALNRLRIAMVSGDWVGLDLQPRLALRAPDCRLVALGGATEASIWSNVFDVDHADPAWSSIPYGTPLPNQRFRVVNAHGDDCPDWVPGELWIGGVGVADGYRGDPDRTADRFLTDADGTRWYRTGDQGRYWPDGTLEFLGRTDHQVKIRGHRIELGEIEAALESHPHITRAVAVVTRDANTAALHAAITTNHPLDTDTLRPWLAQHLANHAIPTTITTLDTLPLTANGKIDRTTITTHIATTRHDAEAEAPRTPLERRLGGLWGELLGIDEIGRGENWVALGGDSVLATRLVAEVEQRIGVSVRLRDLFNAPTIAELAHIITDQLPDEFEEGVL